MSQLHDSHETPDGAYARICREVLSQGTLKPTRTGIRTVSKFFAHYALDMDEHFPIITTKEVNWRAVVAELLWFLSGERTITRLKEHTSIWNDWADEHDEVPSPYGYYWRKWPRPQMMGEIDQLRMCIDELVKNPFSRRLVVSAWEPSNAWTSALPPCHYSFVFNVSANENGEPRRLNLHVSQRSGDIALGIPFNMASYALLAHMVAHEVLRSGGPHLRMGTLAHSIVDAHVYAGKQDGDEWDHRPALMEQLSRKPLPYPALVLPPLKGLDDTSTDDILLLGYNPHPRIKFKVAV